MFPVRYSPNCYTLFIWISAFKGLNCFLYIEVESLQRLSYQCLLLVELKRLWNGLQMNSSCFQSVLCLTCIRPHLTLQRPLVTITYHLLYHTKILHSTHRIYL
jgi:hypothetical protein